MAKTAVEQMHALYTLGILALDRWRSCKMDCLEEYGHIVYEGLANRPTDSGDGAYNAFIREWVDRRIELAEVADGLGIEDESHARHIKEHLDAIYDRELRGKESR